jgi:hypothetical protein
LRIVAQHTLQMMALFWRMQSRCAFRALQMGHGFFIGEMGLLALGCRDLEELAI